MTTAALLLAAGASRRFGAADKLGADLDGQPIIQRSARSLAGSGADLLIAALRDPALETLLPPEFSCVTVAGGQSDSLRAGLAMARAAGASRLLIALGDMPFVPPVLHHEVLVRCVADRPVCAAGPEGPMPPACFPVDLFDRLAVLQGDRGAGALLQGADQVAAEPGWLADIDTCDDLRRLRS